MKTLLYMSMGVPVVCSSVGMNLELIEDGHNGLLAETPTDWISKLEALRSNHAVREKIGAEGRRTVERRYSLEYCAAKFADVVVGTVEARRSALGYDPSCPKMVKEECSGLEEINPR
jgi:glycosyltransferase involved in cell wall biosynthesis